MSNFMWNHPFLGRLLITVVVLAGIAFGLCVFMRNPARVLILVLMAAVFSYLVCLIIDIIEGIYDAIVW